ncbi:amino acid adenylation domain-containing protein [Pseudomonas sp. LPB0260]|uniref:non-ribosomal peptide synthetase n=1 Tax=Pseudomonas sp. LPB0260 TaxID=2614442 RepID=UPI0015C28B5F|nr:non-ribosomal peptide synthetase [Pseudomonas sp. LPB0260]QLC72649.1 amino acid adenylation domain-containing protein [Pseudomonas sp. LPB0260]QLC75423.1 amino acid adenylation domain-containing protein [Pseudomonas sp. LPB0260]
MLLEKLRELSKSSPLQPAVVAAGKSLSYFELERLSSRMAGHLMHAGLPDAALVAIYTSRDVHAIVALFGALKAGAAYSFVEDDGVREENYQRLVAIEADLVLCDSEHLLALREMGVAALDIHAAERALEPGRSTSPTADTSAYVLFTSGSTGKPKGVSVSHGNVAHYSQAIRQCLAIGGGLHYAHVSTLAADLGNTSLFLSLTTGGCLHLLSIAQRKDPSAFRDYLTQHSIDFLKITPSHWNAMFPAGVELPNLQYLVFGGEALPKTLARRVLASGRIARLFNHYGPTETTVGVTAYPVIDLAQLDALAADSVPVGRPFGQSLLYVRDEQGAFRRSAARGELYIGGPSVAQGYRGNPQATANAFVDLERPEGRLRLYKTGDLVSLDDSGLVQFLGRIDRQVKINGYRVELEHVENVLRKVAGVEDAAVFLLPLRGRERLVAALLSERREPPEVWLKQRLQALLPAHMIPGTLLRLDAFPRNANGKTHLALLREQLMARLQHPQQDLEPQPHLGEQGDERLHVIRTVFCKHLRSTSAGLEESFFELGGDSLDAIQLIAELQEKGFPVSAHAFLKAPSIQGLLRTLEQREQQGAQDTPARDLKRLDLFSPAQRELMEQRLQHPDHYNQALLLRSVDKVDMAVLNGALGQLLEQHPALAVAYRDDPQGPYASHVEQDGNDVLSVSFIAGGNEAETQNHVERVADRVHQSLSLAEGRLLRVHLFKVKSGDDLLLLVAHHQAVDVISWRIIIAELTRHYSDRYFGSPAPRSPNPTTFWDWVAHLEGHKQQLQSAWLRRTQARVAALPRYFAEDNVEGAASTLWLGFCAEDSQRLLRDLVSSSGTPLHLLLLAAFTLGLARLRGSRDLAIDVESHGRVTFDDSTDVSRVVGWHTSTFPLLLDLPHLDLSAAIAAVSRAFAEVHDLGVGYGLNQPAVQGRYTPSAPVCFNYLGDVDFAHDERFALVPAPFSFGRARHAQNNRCHELKLTARVIAGQLVLDLSFPRSVEAAAMHELVRGIGSELCNLAGFSARTPQLLLEPGTRTGMINYAPKQLIAQPHRQKHREYRQILLTGATGYIGVYALKELLVHTDAHIHCLVRNKDGSSARARLQRLFAWYFPGIQLEGFDQRLSIHEGDVCAPQLGLDDATYQALARQVEAIYHFAADTRLFGTEEEFARSNVQSVESCIAFALLQRHKDLHYMSTLAVSGVNGKPELAFFSEDSLDIAQEFQNNYEQSKYSAERLLNTFRLQGNNGFIYRAGNVSGDSRSARFQINAKDNRLVQFLAACVKVGQLPASLGEPVILSPVDEVAAGIVALSLDALSPPGTYHVDSVHEVSMERLFAALERAGCSFQRSAHRDFAELFRAISGSQDPDVLLGKFWASRKRRNIKYCNDRTLRALARLGRGFTSPSDEWLDAFIEELKKEHVFALRPGSYEAVDTSRILQRQV